MLLARARTVGVTPAAVKSSAGAWVHLRIARCGNVARTLQMLKQAGYWIVALAPGGEISVYELDTTRTLVVVVGSEGEGIRPIVRKQFLQDHPDPVVPSFSLAAVSDETTTSKMLLEAWKLLTAYDPRTDSQLLESDALIPGGNFLGTLHADHLAVALNYENVAEATIQSAANHNHYPRVALFEAAVRFAVESIGSISPNQ